ncbi:MAG TPA: proline--tRNA ligase [Longimicrobiales bacterium]|nr:proline--tRNA ligase [Longimicrobiales bacterium]
MADEKKLTPRSEDFSSWYNEVVLRAEMAEHSPVRGCMVIRPWGYALWENMQRALDDKFKATGHQNAYFPLFIPLSYIAREAKHVEGFAKEMALVTHTRLIADPDGEGLVPDPASKLEEPLVVRPTSETIIYDAYSRWVRSYRDLPILLNQWANVVRWEMRTRLFLRTSEFLWQEGHTAHATEAEAEQEALTILEVYRSFMEDWMAMPVITGRKSESEKFPGADHTYALEALMQDNRALQAGTSHNLGQNFSKQFDLKYQGESGDWEYAWNTSWGVSTRLVGGLIMTHGDDAGVVMPPKLAPYQVVVTPIWKNDDQRALVLEKAEQVANILRMEHALRVHIDRRDNMSPGAKFWDWERKGVPLRVEVGPKDVEKQQLVLARRVTAEGEDRKEFLSEAAALAAIPERLDDLQRTLLENARRRQTENTHRVSDYDEFGRMLEERGGFYFAGWCGSTGCEDRVKEETRATIRVLPGEEFRSETPPERCLVCGGQALHEAVWARAY